MKFKEIFVSTEDKFNNIERWQGLFLVMIAPFIFLIPLSLIVFLSLLNKNILHLSLNISKSDYIYYYIYTLTIIVSGTLSYMVYKVTTRSNNIAEENAKLSQKTIELQQFLVEKENNRDKQRIKESALIVYYDLYLGLRDIKKLYITCNKNGIKEIQPKRLFFNDNWIERTAIISTDVRLSEIIKNIYELYGELLIIKDFLENLIISEKETVKNFNNGLDRISKIVINENVQNYFRIIRDPLTEQELGDLERILSDNSDISEYLNENYIVILKKLESVSFEN